ncbi:MAG: hypothetical protein AB4080_01075 [Trichodesmium sp.]
MQRPYREQDAPTTVSRNKNNYNPLPLLCTTTKKTFPAKSQGMVHTG